MTDIWTEGYKAALSYAGADPFVFKLREIPRLHRPAYAVMVKLIGKARGRHVATVIPG